jgi:hypothetical protein
MQYLADLKLPEDPCYRALGSIVEIEFVPYNAINNMGIPAGLQFGGPLVLNDNWRFYTLQIVPKTGFFRESLQQSDHGPLYNIQVGGRFEYDDVGSSQTLEALARYFFVVRAKDKSGRWRLIGNVLQKLTFTKRDYVNETIEQRRGFDVEFSGVFSRPALFDMRVL